MLRDILDCGGKMTNKDLIKFIEGNHKEWLGLPQDIRNKIINSPENFLLESKPFKKDSLLGEVFLTVNNIVLKFNGSNWYLFSILE